VRNRIMLDQEEVTPKHHQAYLLLRQRIEDGVYPVDKPMPSEPELTAMFGVSRITIRRALERLQSEGLISRARGRGTFPLELPRKTTSVGAEISGNFDNLVAMGLKSRARLIEFAYVTPPEDIRTALDLTPDAKVQRAVRVRSADDKPFSHLTTYVPREIGQNFSSADLEARPLLLLLEAQGHRIHSATQALSARLADHQVAQVLEVSPGSALLCIRRLVRDATGKPVEYLEGLYRPDMYEYSQNLLRDENLDGVAWTPRD